MCSRSASVLIACDGIGCGAYLTCLLGDGTAVSAFSTASEQSADFTRKEVTSCIDATGSDLCKVVLVAVDGRGVLRLHARAHVRCRGLQHVRVHALFPRAHRSTLTIGQLQLLLNCAARTL